MYVVFLRCCFPCKGSETSNCGFNVSMHIIILEKDCFLTAGSIRYVFVFCCLSLAIQGNAF